MKITKKLIVVLYVLIIVCIALATVVEKYRGTPYVADHIYGAWWFSALWTVLTVASCAYIVNQRLYRRVAVALLHVSFVVILAGALVTHIFARQGNVRLRTGIPEINFVDRQGRVETFPFSLTLKEFRVINYPGTDAPLDYQSVIGVHSSESSEVIVSMNNIATIDGYRLFQSSYDSDGQGVTLGMSYDPWGIAITYVGYLLLLVGIIATLLSRQTQMRSLYRKAMLTLVALMSINASAAGVSVSDALPVVDKEVARRLGAVNVLYNSRICPLNTVATDFLMKLSGSASWQGCSADEVFVSWMIYYSPWEQQKVIRIKSNAIQQMLGISDQWASFSDFLDEYHEYKLKDAVEALRTGKSMLDGIPLEQHRKALLDADEKYHLVEMFYRGQFVRMFPYRIGDAVNWYMPGSQSLPREIPVKEQFFIKQSMDYLTESIVAGDHARAFEIIAKIRLFQHDMIGDVLPAGTTTKAELFYNALRSQRWPVFFSLTLSLLLCVVMIASLGSRWPKWVSLSFTSLLLLYVTLQLVLRWWLSGHIPVSNGPETMLFMAWVVLLLTFLLHKSVPVILGFGPLVASFCLLVAMLGGSSSQITPLMPVLQSPLLSVHVMTVMCAYALFALQMLMGIHALLLIRKTARSSTQQSIANVQPDNAQQSIANAQLDKLTALSRLLLYPAVFLLAVGIFLGAVWANVSWGNYWSWDPKESWALITMMAYAVPFHAASIPAFRKPLCYHLYMVFAFLTVVITYFGVNYLLGGMHSYA